jgi:hypothetical protein
MNQNRAWFAALAATAAVVTGSFAAEPAAGPAPAQAGLELFTASEAAAWNSPQSKQPDDFKTRDLSEDSGAPTCRSAPDNDADNPKIRVLAPPIGRMLTAPLDIELQFVPTASAPIRPETFRVCYIGLITMDITKRITDRVAVSATGLRVTGAKLPPGRHRLMMLIGDERGRLGRSEVLLNIE